MTNKLFTSVGCGLLFFSGASFSGGYCPLSGNKTATGYVNSLRIGMYDTAGDTGKHQPDWVGVEIDSDSMKGGSWYILKYADTDNKTKAVISVLEMAHAMGEKVRYNCTWGYIDDVWPDN